MRQVSLEQALEGQDLMAVREVLLRIVDVPEFTAARQAPIEAPIGPESLLERHSRNPFLLARGHGSGLNVGGVFGP